MIKKILFALFALMWVSSGPVMAGDEAGKAYAEMAEILSHLNHYPSDEEKEKLREMRDESGSSAVKVLATAMINLQHKATSADKAKLRDLLNRSDVPEAAKTLANVLLHLNHKPTSSDKKALSAIRD